MKIIIERGDGMAKKEKLLMSVHSGEVLNIEFMQPLKISQNKLTRDIGIPPRRINQIVHGERVITAIPLFV